MLAVVIIAIAAHLLFGVKRVWFPEVFLRRSIERQRLPTSICCRRPGARVVEVIRPRLAWLTREPFIHSAAGLCNLVTLSLPPLQTGVVMASWAAIAAFGLAPAAYPTSSR